MASYLAPYAADHEDTNGAGDARPTALKIIRDERLDNAMAGKVFFITGGSGGIGLETARAIHVAGADVYITGQSREKGEAAVASITGDGKPGNVVFLEMSLQSLKNVREVGKKFLELSGGKLNVLICNAGIRGYPKDKTEDGFEQHFGINHLGHFALFQVVKDALVASSTPTYNSRVVVLSATGHRQSQIRFDDFNFDNRPDEYQPLIGYAQSKIANVYMALEIERRFAAHGVHATSVNPGVILGTELNRKTPPEQLKALLMGNPMIRNALKSPEQGAATTVWAATAKAWEGVGGKLLENVQVAIPYDKSKGVFSHGYAAYAYDEGASKRLWVESLKLVGLDE